MALATQQLPELFPNALGLNSAAVPLPQASNAGQQLAAAGMPPPAEPRPGPVVAPPVARLPRPRPPTPDEEIAAAIAEAQQLPPVEPSPDDEIAAAIREANQLQPAAAQAAAAEPVGLLEEAGRSLGRGWAGFKQSGPLLGAALGLPQATPVEQLTKQYEEEAKQYPPSATLLKGYADLAANKGDFAGTVGALWRNPRLIMDVPISSLPSSIPSAVGAALGGRMGLLAGSTLGEAASSIGDYMRDHGVDLGDMEQVKTFLDDPEKRSAARDYAAVRGLTVGAFDAATSFISGNLLHKLVEPTTIARKVGGAALGTAAEGVGGATGEAAAEAATGQPIDWSQVVPEFLGEAVTGPIGDVGGLALGQSSHDAFARNELLTEDQQKQLAAQLGTPPVAGLLPPPSATQTQVQGGEPGTPASTVLPTGPTIYIGSGGEATTTAPAMTIEEAVGKGMYVGFDTGEGTVEVTRVPSQAEAAAAKAGVRTGEFVAFDPKQVTTTPTTNGILTGNVFTAPSGAGQRVVQQPVDYAGLQVPAVSTLTGGTHMVRGTGTYDIDLAKLPQGALIPSYSSVQTAAARLGKQGLLEAHRQAGSSEEGLKVLEQNLGPGGFVVPVLQAYEDGRLVVPKGPDFFSHGATIAQRPGAVEEVKKALVPLTRGMKRVGELAQRGRLPKAAPAAGPQQVQTLQSPNDWLRAFGLRADLVEQVKAAVEVMNQIMKGLESPFPLTVVIRNIPAGVTPPTLGPPTNLDANGYFSLSPDFTGQGATGTIVINADAIMESIVSTLRPRHGVYNTLAHEFGHYLSATGLWAQTAATRTGVFSAYRRAVNDMMYTQGNVQAKFARFAAGREKDPYSTDYHMNFEEWFADQVARYAVTGRKPVGIVAKAVRPVARLLLKAMKLFEQKDPTNLLRAEPEIEKFLNTALAGTRTREAWATTIQLMHDKQTQERNAKATKTMDYGPMTPETDQGVAVGNVVEKLFGGEVELSKVPVPPGQSAMSHLKPTVDRFNWFYKYFLSLPQVAAQNPGIQPLQNYRELVQLSQLEQNQIVTAAQKRMSQWEALGRVEQKAVGQFMLGMTTMEYLTPQEAAAGVVRRPTQQEVQAMLNKYKLGQRGAMVVAGIDQDFQAALKRNTQLLWDEAGKITDPVARKAARDQVKKEFRQMQMRPYFPLSRYGKWAVEVRSAKGKLVQFELFESQRQQKAAGQRAIKQFPRNRGFNVSVHVMNEETWGMSTLTPQMLTMMQKKLKLSAAQEQAAEQLKFQLSPAQSFRKHFLRRKYTPGWNDDAKRAFAHYFFHHAKYYSRVKYKDLLDGQIKATRDLKNFRPVTAATPGGGNRITRIANFMQEHLEEMLNPKADWSALRGAVALWYLGANPKSALLNLTQLAIATHPYLATKFAAQGGDVVIPALMLRTAADVRALYTKDLVKSNANKGGWWKALDRAIEEGIIDESMAVELAALAQGNTIMKRINQRSGWTKFASTAMVMFRMAEQFNRRVTFLTAYRAAMQFPNNSWVGELAKVHAIQVQRLKNAGFSDVEAAAFVAGKDAVERTQFDYSRVARPRYIRGKAGAVLPFQMFTQQMMFLYGTSSGTAVRGMLVLMLLGGMMGLPGMEDLDELVKAMAYRFDKNWDIELEARKMVSDLMGPLVADMALHGLGRDALNSVPALMDMPGATNLPQFDLSRSIGLGRLLPVNPAALFGDPGVEYEKTLSQFLERDAGALSGIGMHIFQTINDVNTPWSDPRRWERSLPTAVKNTVQFFRRMSGQAEKTRNGAEVVPFSRDDPVQLMENIGGMLGFQSTRLSRAYDLTSAKIEQNRYWASQRQALLDTYNRAVVDKDTEMRNEVRKAIVEFNKATPDKTFAITQETLQRSVKSRARSRQRIEQGLPPTRMGSKLSRDLERYFPGAAEVRKPSELEKSP